MSVPYNDWLVRLTHKARLRERAGLRRSAAAFPGGIDLAGNDYLGLSSDPRVVEAFCAAARRYGMGAKASRLVRGTSDLHVRLESRLADWMGTASSLVFSSGYLANLGVISALARTQPQCLLVLDAHCHASMIDGVRLARAEFEVFTHGSAAALESVLEKHAGRPMIVLTESVFSVDGDLAPLWDYHDAARRFGALLMIDDAHGLGVVDPPAMAGQPDVIITATLSKALGGAGGFVAGPDPLIRHLIDTCRTFIFDTAPPPAVVAGVLAALDIAGSLEGDALRAELHERASMIEDGTPGGVVSLRAPSAVQAVEWAAACRDKGVAVGCFRPPSTPDGTSRLRLTINAGVPRADFEHALEVIAQCRP
ncbi:8-amino-7-oxononanoate synthase [Allorhizocola rhizosphaerae]|uniref:8-amino-7-oxononanoate synthase n=1 Tax=Allorhizocola rhizosphaerae TaxID=1872709 RepID=UPI000E3E490F|nr:8-amino-7-oxononanoate synthase [Allorhizocola rhizosphaerae]